MSEQRFVTPAPVRLEITVAAGDIDVGTVDGEESLVMLEGPRWLVEQTRVELVGERLIIEEPRHSFVSLVRVDQSLEVVARVPHLSSVAVTTASSETTLDGTFGGVEMKSASGDVTVTGEVDGDVLVKSASGDVQVPRVTGRLDAQSVSGDVAAGSVDGPVTVRSVSGDVHLASLRAGEVSIQSVSGDVELGIEAGSCIDVDAASTSGDLSSDVPLSGSTTGEHGPTVVIRSHSVSGDFRIFRAARSAPADVR